LLAKRLYPDEPYSPWGAAGALRPPADEQFVKRDRADLKCDRYALNFAKESKEYLLLNTSEEIMRAFSGEEALSELQYQNGSSFFDYQGLTLENGVVRSNILRSSEESKAFWIDSVHNCRISVRS
jgi:hypothetical protein